MAARDSNINATSLHFRDEERYIYWVNASVFVPGRRAHGSDWFELDEFRACTNMAARNSNIRPASLHFRDEERDIEWVNAPVFVPGRKAHGSARTKSQGTQTESSDLPKAKEICSICTFSLDNNRCEEQKDEQVEDCPAIDERFKAAMESMERCEEMECLVCKENILDTQNPSRLPGGDSFRLLDTPIFSLPCLFDLPPTNLESV